MNRRILALVFGFVWLLACGDNAPRLISDASSEPPPSPDAAVPDAAMPDAAMPDASPDAAIPPDAFVDTSVRLRYDFEESSTVVKDSSGRGLDGTLNDVLAWTADGRNGRGLALSTPPKPPGTNNPALQFVSLPSGVLTGVDDFTISVWVNFKTISNWARVYDVGNGPVGVGTRWMFLSPRGFIEPAPGVFVPGVHATSFAAGVPDDITNAGTELPTGVWKHLTVTGTGGNRTLYVDGFPTASLAGGTVIPASEMEPLAPDSWLGRSRFEGVPFNDPGLDATLDDFRIYNKVLTQPEIADLAWPQHDYSYWRFDEGAGATTKDSSDNNIATVLMNGATWTTGRLGGAISLPGGPGGAAGPHVEFASNPIASCTTSLTIAAWVKVRQSANWARVFDFGDGAGTFIFLAATDGAGMHFAMGKAATPAFDLVAPQPIPADDAFHHVAVTIIADGTVTLYMNGSSVASAPSLTLKPSDYAGMTQNWLGRSQFAFAPMFPDPYLNGAIDDLRISCRAFTADEIKNLSHP